MTMNLNMLKETRHKHSWHFKSIWLFKKIPFTFHWWPFYSSNLLKALYLSLVFEGKAIVLGKGQVVAMVVWCLDYLKMAYGGLTWYPGPSFMIWWARTQYGGWDGQWLIHGRHCSPEPSILVQVLWYDGPEPSMVPDMGNGWSKEDIIALNQLVQFPIRFFFQQLDLL